MPLTRTDFQKLSEMRLREARSLLWSGHPSGAYYLAGYAVECALKACIARNTREFDFPPDKTAVDKIYRHESHVLVQSSGLKAALDVARKADAALDANWTILAGWDVVKRYETSISNQDAQALIRALDDTDHGVMQWLRQHW